MQNPVSLKLVHKQGFTGKGRTFFTSRRRWGSAESRSEMESAWISITLMAMRTSLTLLLPCASLAAHARHQPLNMFPALTGIF